MAAPFIPEKDRIPVGQKVAFATGSITNTFTYYITTAVVWNAFFNLGHKLDAQKLGLVLMAMTIWDAITDPLMGWISDNTRTRWGRRRPYMFIAAILIAIMYPIFWHTDYSNRDVAFSFTGWLAEFFGAAPGLPYVIEWVYLKIMLMGMALYTFNTMWAMPYYGLELEMTPNYDERTRMSAWCTFAGKIVGLLTGTVMLLLTSSWVQGVSSEQASAPGFQPDLIKGTQVISWGFAVLILVVAITPALFIRERYYAKDASKQPYEPFWSGVVKSARCGPLWSLIGIAFFLVLSGQSVGGLARYINQFYVSEGNLQSAAVIEFWVTAASLIGGMASIPFWTWVSERLDKKWVVAVIVGSAMFGSALNYVCLNPRYPYLQILPAVFNAFIIAAIWMFLPSMKGDVADYDELKNGKRREGSINSFFSWSFKVSTASSAALGGIVLARSGFDPLIVQQPPEVLRSMVRWYIWLPLLISCVTLFFTIIYPLTRARMQKIRTELEGRRGTI